MISIKNDELGYSVYPSCTYSNSIEIKELEKVKKKIRKVLKKEKKSRDFHKTIIQDLLEEIEY